MNDEMRYKIVRNMKNIVKSRRGRKPKGIDSVEYTDTICIIRLKGELDGSSMHKIIKNIHREYMKKNKHILIDFKKVKSVDTSTIAMLLGILIDIKTNDMKMGIMNPSRELKAYISINKMSEVIDVYKTEGQAKKELNKRTVRGRSHGKKKKRSG